VFGSTLDWRPVCGGPNVPFRGAWGWWSAWVRATLNHPGYDLTIIRHDRPRGWIVEARLPFDTGHRLLARSTHRNLVEALQWAEEYAAH
jgi:hypothetical protein